mmetsp:Transcript_16197/g.31345  ORF Transcript_16197/g.31345 Transcript_16197/m.31345 type:complete len:152 (+) Transcript_16197:320-775(+)
MPPTLYPECMLEDEGFFISTIVIDLSDVRKMSRCDSSFVVLVPRPSARFVERFDQPGWGFENQKQCVEREGQEVSRFLRKKSAYQERIGLLDEVLEVLVVLSIALALLKGENLDHVGLSRHSIAHTVHGNKLLARLKPTELVRDLSCAKKN